MSQKIDFVDIYDFLLKNDVTEPVTIVKHGQPCAVMIPHEIYEAMRKDRKALQAHELSDEDMQAIMDAEIPEELKQYNHEVKGK
ncbi:MAG: type II toxin-antitoxin system prevent-host-death family antitoxin [Alphaproteobacteria bacterium]|nr:MAG: type II toxin-antitoxin system prevent-host-death family antitoxin [Alphaproteobacteria bacterium]